MPWKYSGRVIRVGRSWEDNNGIKHPNTWGKWSDADKTAAGLTWEPDPQPFDSKFYWDADTPKSLDDVNEVDENGDPVLDEDGNQVVTKGLKSVFIAQVKAQAGGLLKETDWMIIREAEDTTKPVSDSVKTLRKAIRDKSDEVEVAIAAATTVEELKAALEIEWPEGSY